MATTELRAKITADGRGYLRTMRQVGKATAQAVAYIAAAGAAGAAAYGALVKSSADYMDALSKASKRTGADPLRFQEQVMAAELADVTLEDLTTAYKGMANAITDAGRGNKQLIGSFRAIGLNAKTIASLAPEAQFDAIAEALAGVQDETMRSALAQDLFGRSGTKLLTMMAAGASGYRAALRERERLGPIFTKEQLESAEEFNDSLTRVAAALKIGGAALVAGQMPILAEGFNRVAAAVGALASSPEFARVSEQLTAMAGNAATTIGLLTGLDVGQGQKGLGALADAMQRLNAELTAIQQNGSLMLLRDVLALAVKVIGANIKVAQFIPERLLNATTNVATGGNAAENFNARAATPQDIAAARERRRVSERQRMIGLAQSGQVTPDMVTAMRNDPEIRRALERIAANTGPLPQLVR